MDLVEKTYMLTRSWPKEEVYGLSAQLRRAVVSVPANIAEGQGRQGTGEFLHHLSIANGSLHEVETHILIATRLGYVEESGSDQLIRQCAEIGRLIYGLMRSLREANKHNDGT
jgi:four helix bundle protein